MEKPRALIYSAREDIDLARAIQAELRDCLNVVIWSQDTFPLSESNVDGLTKNARACDFGIFILAPHDRLQIRAEEFAAPRDNVLFELGIFIGRLGKTRNFLVVPSSRQLNLDLPLRIASDLKGFVHASYDLNGSDLQAAVGPACMSIRKQVKKLGRYYLDEAHIVNKHSGKCLDVSGWGRSDGTPVIQYEYHGGANQKWRFYRLEEEDFFQITSRISGKCLDVRATGDRAGELVQQDRWDGRESQQWRLERQGDGSCFIMAKHSEKYLTVEKASRENKAAVIQADRRDDDTFKWWINSHSEDLLSR